MKLSVRSILPFVYGTAVASQATVYLLKDSDNAPLASSTPVVSPNEARLILAQRLGVSQYHGISGVSEETLGLINKFGSHQGPIFSDSRKNEVVELVMFIEGASTTEAETLLSTWPPAFTIHDPPSKKANSKLIEDFREQLEQSVDQCDLEDTINPFDLRCWSGKAKVLQVDMSQKMENSLSRVTSIVERLNGFAQRGEMNVMLILLPQHGNSKGTKSYGSYNLPSQLPLHQRQAERIKREQSARSNAAFISRQESDTNETTPLQPVTGVPPVCYRTLDLCISTTNNCSGHGKCYTKSGTDNGEDASQSCFACLCDSTIEIIERPGKEAIETVVNWGGAACQKRDISSSFWLLTISTIIMIGLVGWAIGMLFSIGEEKLPGVIGAGVSSRSR